ncbi:MAG: methyltransferase [Alphaproteobacteria bacterium MedPE-SWcel]|nr:MAG: methyltransferase [Alphaproteobacteria bacterium MedPE-SWcel]
MPYRSVPGQASVAENTAGGKLFAPSAARNLPSLLEVVTAHAPARGRALEIASGTGQHVVGLARALPQIDWQPSDIDATRRASIDAHVSEAALGNVSLAAAVDATSDGWGALIGPFDLLLLANLLHLISAAEAETLLGESARALTPGRPMVIYGPFRREGRLTSTGDQRFDAALRAHDPEIGYKDVAEITNRAAICGLELTAQIDMPANNLCLILSRT